MNSKIVADKVFEFLANAGMFDQTVNSDIDLHTTGVEEGSDLFEQDPLNLKNPHYICWSDCLSDHDIHFAEVVDVNNLQNVINEIYDGVYLERTLQEFLDALSVTKGQNQGSNYCEVYSEDDIVYITDYNVLIIIHED